MSSFVAPVLQDDEDAVERTLRPRSLDEFVGQERVKEQLAIALEATRSRGEALDHLLLIGPPGLGKTSLAYIVREDAARFQAIPGIGKKTAERIVLELKEKLAASVSIAPATGGTDADEHVVARDALVELGYSLVDAERALAATDAAASPEERVRQALRRAA